MSQNMLILTATGDFLMKFEKQNVQLLQDKGFVVHYASNMHEPMYIDDYENLKRLSVIPHHIDIARSPFMFYDNQKALRQILKILKDYDISFIHCHTPVGGLLGRLASKLFTERDIPVIYTAHGFHFYKGAPFTNRFFYYNAEKELAKFTDVLITINEEDFKNAKKLKLKEHGKVFKIPGIGLNRGYFSPLDEKTRLKTRMNLNIDKDDFLIVSAGEINENKNHIVVLEALCHIRSFCSQSEFKNIKYLICGDGFLRDKIENAIKNMFLSKNVTVTGYRQDIRDIIGCADVTVFPSKREGLGMAGLESLSMGIPVIASDNRGTREYMLHSKNGYVYRFDDFIGFAEGIMKIKHMGESQKLQMKSNCIASTAAFDAGHTAKIMEKVYGYIIDRIDSQDNSKNEKN